MLEFVIELNSLKFLTFIWRVQGSDVFNDTSKPPNRFYFGQQQQVHGNKALVPIQVLHTHNLHLDCCLFIIAGSTYCSSLSSNITGVVSADGLQQYWNMLTTFLPRSNWWWTILPLSAKFIANKWIRESHPAIVPVLWTRFSILCVKGVFSFLSHKNNTLTFDCLNFGAFVSEAGAGKMYVNISLFFCCDFIGHDSHPGVIYQLKGNEETIRKASKLFKRFNRGNLDGFIIASLGAMKVQSWHYHNSMRRNI